jgi:hypothetical protein
MAAIILLKAHVKAHDRRLPSGQVVQVAAHTDRRHTTLVPGQLALFTRHGEPLRPNPYKGKDPVKDTPDLFEHIDPPRAAPAAPPPAPDPAPAAAPPAPTQGQVTTKRVRSDGVESAHTVVTMPDGSTRRIGRSKLQGFSGWADLDHKAAAGSYLGDTEKEAIAELLRR